MDSLSGLMAFVRAAEARSYVEAGRQLGLSASAVGKSVARMEAQLGVRLLQRSTRRIGLTDEGALFYERCRRILAELEDAQAELSRSRDAPRGRLRVSLPAIGHRMLLPVLPAFMRQYPEVELDLDFNDVLVDIIEEGFDVVIRSGTLNDSRLMAKRLGPFRFVIAGAPAYLQASGAPATPDALVQHACLHYKFPSTGKLQEWAMERNGVAYHPRLPATMTCNNIEALISAARQGLGLAYLPEFIVRPLLADGSLQAVLAPYTEAQGVFWIVWPSNKQISPKVRAFVDFLHDNLNLVED